ncbi:hypothetical protein [Nitratireductor basaltis]|uniref:Uncharacterized protein n=1 Tax=Nitratireductor basaltis TaxID=472175 RepID=A0A084U9M0_9HYPH|nr:hypothetical protein [Nitratireductor basaltis]KFB09656.1 hypothetical protein EL18_00673 [Nitratireductor basaltis]
MKKIALTTLFAMAVIQAASAHSFQPSEPNSGPGSNRAIGIMMVDRSINTASVGTSRRAPVGFSAASGFAVSDSNDRPEPTFYRAR